MEITRIGNIASTIPDDSIQNAKFSNIVQSKNVIINGDMSIAQRGTSISGISYAGGDYILDRFEFRNLGLGTWTVSQETDVPSGQGFAKSTKLDCTTADASPASGDILIYRQIVEGQNLQYLKKGTANAESLTASFWVKSNKTGTYIIELLDNDNNRNISQSYTINTANTWEKKTVTFAGDTTGAFDNDNGGSLYCHFWLGAGTDFTSGTLQTSWGSTTNTKTAVGQVNLADSTSNEFFITGIQLEAGTSASDFEFLPVDVNLQRCQRYYQVLAPGGDKYIPVVQYQGSFRSLAYVFSTKMRAVPSLSVDTFAGFSSFNGIDMTENSVHAYVSASSTLNTSYIVRGARLNAEL